MAGPTKTTEVAHHNLAGTADIRDEFTRIRVNGFIDYSFQFLRKHHKLVGLAAIMCFLYGVTGSWLRSFAVVAILAATILWAVLSRRKRNDEDFGLEDLWNEYRRRKFLKPKWAVACRAAGLISSDGREIPPRLRKIKAPVAGQLTARVDSGTGVFITKMQEASASMADVLKCRQVTVVPTGAPGEATVYFDWRPQTEMTVSQFAPQQQMTPYAPPQFSPQQMTPYSPQQMTQQMVPHQSAHHCVCQCQTAARPLDDTIEFTA